MANISDKQVKQVVNHYNTTESILETAKVSGLSTVKVRKILITLGLWESETSIAIGRLLQEGLTTEQIAARLFMSVKNVQAYMPYERGIYQGEELTAEAIRSDKYRKRMKHAASMQIKNGIAKSETRKRVIDMSTMNLTEQSNQKRNSVTKVMRLHCELNMEYVDDEEKAVLTKFGSMKHGISRDILVPADITLHALHFAIMRMFGWQNSHLHCYKLPDTVFDELTEQRFLTWTKLAGVYFRFPTEDYADLYWDDDYKEGQSIKSWMKKKYTGPYLYKGFSEHYLDNQLEVIHMFRRYPEITVRQFSWDKEKEPYEVKLEDATVKEVEMAFTDVMCHELLERLPLEQILYTPELKTSNIKMVRELLYRKLSEIDVRSGISTLASSKFKSFKKQQEFFEKNNVVTYPITDVLHYSYDYGDGWEVEITCDGLYLLTDSGNWISVNDSPSVSREDLEEVAAKYRPICIAKDGIELLDDVGGIGGFCDMLRVIYNTDRNNPEQAEAREEMLEWANMMGWTGRRISPKHTL